MEVIFKQLQEELNKHPANEALSMLSNFIWGLHQYRDAVLINLAKAGAIEFSEEVQNA